MAAEAIWLVQHLVDAGVLGQQAGAHFLEAFLLLGSDFFWVLVCTVGRTPWLVTALPACRRH